MWIHGSTWRPEPSWLLLCLLESRFLVGLLSCGEAQYNTNPCISFYLNFWGRLDILYGVSQDYVNGNLLFSSGKMRRSLGNSNTIFCSLTINYTISEVSFLFTINPQMSIIIRVKLTRGCPIILWIRIWSPQKCA